MVALRVIFWGFCGAFAMFAAAWHLGYSVELIATKPTFSSFYISANLFLVATVMIDRAIDALQ